MCKTSWDKQNRTKAINLKGNKAVSKGMDDGEQIKSQERFAFETLGDKISKNLSKPPL